MASANPNRAKIYPGDINIRQANFFSQMLSHEYQYSLYSDPILQTQALSLIPQQKIREEAQNCEDNLSFDDKYLKQLMNWFKEEFFSWFNKAHCNSCDLQTENRGLAEATTIEKVSGAVRIELFQCPQCKEYYRFPRFNHPLKLLTTRTGRCGEWANCFTLICIASGFEARIVYDTTDHVWTEYWSQNEQRWIHVDACENAYDKPKLYESGWGKKLEYCIAYGLEQIQDVTKRYVIDYNKTHKLRLSVIENKLVQFIMQKNREKMQTLDHSRRTEISKRAFNELVELICDQSNSIPKELEGRKSGNKEWRESRGETRNNKNNNNNIENIIDPSNEELSAKTFIFEYSCVEDFYTRPLINAKYKGFKTLTYKCENLFRKKENDWNKVYIARYNNNDAEISWKIKIPEGSSLKSVDLTFLRNVFETGRINVTICSGEICSFLGNNDSISLKSEDVKNWKEIEIKAILSGGNGENSWQHTQLFRSDATDKNCKGLVVKITWE